MAVSFLLLVSILLSSVVAFFIPPSSRYHQHRCRFHAATAPVVVEVGDDNNNDNDNPLEDDYKQRFVNVARLYPQNVDVTLRNLRDANVLVVGLGGVGSWVVEALARSGIGRFTIVDMDDICISNTNRQLPALTSSVGRFKADALKDRILDINPYAQVEVVLDFVRDTNVDDIIAPNVPPEAWVNATAVDAADDEDGDDGDDNGLSDDAAAYQLTGPPRFSFVVDAADGVTDKAYIIDACVRSGTPLVVSGGVGGLTDPTLLRVSDITAAAGDKLIMQVRFI